jgi:hypothetical protein
VIAKRHGLSYCEVNLLLARVLPGGRVEPLHVGWQPKGRECGKPSVSVFCEAHHVFGKGRSSL